jgi:hypothetical protein
MTGASPAGGTTTAREVVDGAAWVEVAGCEVVGGGWLVVARWLVEGRADELGGVDDVVSVGEGVGVGVSAGVGEPDELHAEAARTTATTAARTRRAPR